MKNILVPIDFSECAIDALKVAAELARKAGATIHLLHVHEKPLSGIALQVRVDSKELTALRTEIQQEMQRLEKEKYLQGITCVRHFVLDKQIWQVLRSSELRNVDLIVMGSHGARGAKELFVGSNTQKIVQLSEVPVLVIKEYVDPGKIKDILFASDFRREAESGFLEIKAMADLFGAKVHLLKVITPRDFEGTEKSTHTMEVFAKNMNLANYSVNTYNDRSVEQGIYEFAETIGADLIAIETHGNTGFAHFIMGSIAEQVVNHSSLPILSSRITEPDSLPPIPPGI